MKHTAIICALALLLVPCLAQADIAEIMSYQGVLRDGSGDPVPDGSYDVTFRIYDVEAAGTALWTENQTLTATGGIISAHLGSVTTLSTLDFDVPYWLGISVEGGAELVPRTAFTTVPYAAHAGFADTCLEGDNDWGISGDNIYHDVGYVGIGTVTPGVRLDVLAADELCARFVNGSSGSNFAVKATNYGGTAGAFFSGMNPGMYPAIPAAVFGRGATGYRAGHFSSEEQDGIFVHSVSGRAVYAASPSNYAGYFGGGGLGVYIEDQLETNGFRMQLGAADSYVLTSDVDGIGSWQPAGTGADSDWTIAGIDMYSGVPGRVGIGLATPTAKLEVYNVTTEEALEVKHGGASAGRVVNIERVSMPSSGNDLLQLKIPAGSPATCQFIEAEYGSTVNFAVDGDGFVKAVGGGEFSGPVSVTNELDVTGSSVHQAEVRSSALTPLTKVLSGISTALGTGVDAVGVYGECVPGINYGIGGLFTGGYIGVKGTVIPGEVGSYYGVRGQANAGNGTNHGVYGSASGGAINYGVYGYAFTGTHYAGYFSGNAHVTNTFTAGIKSFKIDHPLDPENRYLLHSCVESDEMMNVYNGNVSLDGGGEATIEMPEWFEALNQDFRYQLTPIGAPGPNLYVAEEIRGNRFQIAGGEPGMKVSWLVTGVRHDPLAVASRMVVEVDKPANEVGKYMHPEAYGMPLTAGVDYHEEREIPNEATAAERTARPVRDRSDGD